MQAKLDSLTDGLTALCDKNNIHISHGVGHAKTVMKNGKNMIKSEKRKITAQQKLVILCACLLHDADDGKLFPNNKNDENMRTIAHNIITPDETDTVALLIGLVSASKNGDSRPTRDERTGRVIEWWMFIPREADRLDAIGYNGALRCISYSEGLAEKNGKDGQGAKMVLPETVLAKTRLEIAKIATPERFAEYMKRGGKSASVIDHIYDKLWGLLRDSDNPYVKSQVVEGRRVLENLVMFATQCAKDGKELTHKMGRIFLEASK